MRQPLPVLALGCILAAGQAMIATEASAQVPQKVEHMASPAPSAFSAPKPIGVEADVYCTGWLADEPEAYPATIVSAELVDSKDSFIEGDVLYLDAGASTGLAAGQEFWIVRPTRTVYRWESVTDRIGQVSETPGRVRVLCVQETSAIAEIVLSCSDTRIGDRVLPFEPIPIPLVRRTPPLSSCDPKTGKITGQIVDVHDAITPLHIDTVVYLDIGEMDGLLPGDFLSIYRYPTSATTQVATGELAMPASTTTNLESIRTTLGELAILTTRKTTSVAIITSMRDTMYVGDRVELK